MTGNQNLSYALFILSGIMVFNFWSEMAFRAPMLLHEYVHFIKQTIFPSDMLAVISTLRATLYTVISLGVLIVFQLIATGGLPWTMLLLPLIMIPFIAFLVGMSWFLCAIGAFTRDAGYLMINIVPLFMFATPVFYRQSIFGSPGDISDLHQRAHRLCRRDARYHARRKTSQLAGLCLDLFTSVFTFYFGYWFFDRYRNVIVDVI